MEKLKILFLCFSIQAVDLKLFGHNAVEGIMGRLIAYDSAKIKENADKFHLSSESIYYSPYRALEDNLNATSVVIGLKKSVKRKRGADTTFRGKPKTIQEVWARTFNMSSQEYSQSTSLINLMNKIILKYMTSCIPVILYDSFVESSDGFILQRLFKTFPTSFLHGKISDNNTLENKELLEATGSKCRSFILFISDALKTRQIIGPQIDNRVIVVPRSTQVCVFFIMTRTMKISFEFSSLVETTRISFFANFA